MSYPATSVRTRPSRWSCSRAADGEDLRFRRAEGNDNAVVSFGGRLGALLYWRTRNDVLPDRIALQGWSNGASATLATMSSSTPALNPPTLATGFRGAVAFYPGCGLDGHTAATRDATADAKAFLAALLKRK